MKYRFLLPIISLILAQSSITQADDLLAGLEFQSTKDEVIETLENSDLVISQIKSELFGRVGLNGAFQAKHSIADLLFDLHFGWEEKNNDKLLNELTLHSKPIEISTHKETLIPAYEKAVELLSKTHNKPISAGAFPNIEKLAEGGILYSHAWKGSSSHIYMGVGKSSNKLKLIISFFEQPLHARKASGAKKGGAKKGKK